MIDILHIIPHLGGGVGKALSTLITSFEGTNYTHTFLLLERPDKKQFLDIITEFGCEVHVSPNAEIVDKLIGSADIVQLEWWDHPAIFKFLCQRDLPAMRLLIWSHVSGLCPPLFPDGLVGLAHRFIFTSECSFKAESVRNLSKVDYLRLAFVSSGVGFPQRNDAKFNSTEKLSFGFMGSLNSSKIHPEFINYLSGVSVKDFQVSIWADGFYKDKLISQCDDIGKHHLIKFEGYTTDPAATLSELDVFIYLLNPSHYGTAENVLLEAMSLGVVPIVMNNLSESMVVEHGVTGLVVSNPKEFSDAVEWLLLNPDEREVLSKNASEKIANFYTPEIMCKRMSSYYDEVMLFSKIKVNFKNVLGESPYDWFMACKTNKSDELSDVVKMIKNDEVEETKGSLKHFLDYFPKDLKLKSFNESVKLASS